MANTIRIKRRASNGAVGAPTTLAPSELAYNEADNTLYYGFGDGGVGLASSVISVAGSGGFVTTGSTQTVSGPKTFSNITITGGSISGITDLAVADGGTGASTASGARANLSAAVLGANSDITSITGLTTALTVAQGGTGSATASGARVNLLPTYTANGGKVIAVNSGGTDVEYVNRVSAVTILGDTSIFDFNAWSSSTTITTQGSLSVELQTQTKNKVLISGVSTTSKPTFRALDALDIPALNYASTGANSNITSLTGLTTALSIAQGGTGSTTAVAALTALGAYPATNPSNYSATVGTVTSVGMMVNTNYMTLDGGTEITTSGTFGIGFKTQSKATVFAGPATGADAAVGFRALVSTDIPALDYLPITGGTVSGALVVTGDLTINGTTTTISSSVLSVADKNIELAKGSSTEAGATGGGITLHGLVDHTIIYTTGTSSWDFSEHMNLVTGKAYKINGTAVLSATALMGVDVDGGSF